jgi:hypothetical protein
MASPLQQLLAAVKRLSVPDTMPPPGSRAAWLPCTVLTWEVRQRARLLPLLEAVRLVEAAHGFVGSDYDLMRMFFAVLGGTYVVAGAPLPLPALTAMFDPARPGAAENELALLTAAISAEIAAQAARGTICARCPFTGESIHMLPDKRLALCLSL